jgi:glycosyltransferase involved in cell wall biosynthesis
MTEPIRILHVLGALNRGGAETFIMNVYRNIDRKRVQFDFIIHTEEKCDYTDEIINMGGRIYSIPKYKGTNHYQYINRWREFYNAHKEYKIVHGHMRSTASIYLKIAKNFGIISIAHSHSTSSGTGIAAIAKNLLQIPLKYRADFLFACSYDAGKWLFHNKVNSNNFFVVKNGIDVMKYVFDDKIRKKIRAEFEIDNDIFVIGHVGRFSCSKNHEFLVKIFFEYEKLDNKCKLLLVGKGPEIDSTREIVNKLKLTDKVIFAGVRDNVNEILQAMDFFVFPSKFEGLGIVAIEAQATGLYCLVSDKVPNEVKVTSNVEFMALENGSKEWAYHIFKNKDYKRINSTDSIIEAGYDIEKTSDFLLDTYLKFY